MKCMDINRSGFSVMIFLSFIVTCISGQDIIDNISSKKDALNRSINEIKEDVTMPTFLEDSTTMKNTITTEGGQMVDQTTTFSTETTKSKTKQRTKPERKSATEAKTRKPRPAQTTHKPTMKPPPTPASQRSLDPTDQYLLDGILDIVDEKFSTLNKRLMTLERGVNNLQYYNVRSFRVVNTHLHAVDTILHTMHSQVGHMEENGKVVEQIVGAVKDEVIDLQTTNSGMFQAIEQNLIHFHTDLAAKISNVKEGIEHTNANMQQLRNDTVDINDQIGIMKQSQEDLYQNAAANAVILSELLESSIVCQNVSSENSKDQKDIKRMSKGIDAHLSEISKSVSAITIGTFEIKQSVESALSNISVANVDTESTEENEHYREFKSKNTHASMPVTCGKLIDILDEKFKSINVTIGDNNVKCRATDSQQSVDSREFKNQTKKLLRALSTVNENIYQSVTLYKHTGNLIERVISDTEDIATEQVRLREELLAYLMNGTFDLFNQSIPDVAARIASRQEEPKSVINGSQCALSKTLVDEILKLSFNGSQLMELLTELATTSSASFKTSIEKLDQEVTRLNKVQDLTLPPVHSKADTFIRDDPKAGGNSQLRDIQNRTDMIYTIVEAIASNTGWIPYVFHNVRFVENQINKTLKLVNTIDARSEEILVRQRANMAIMFKPKGFIRASPTTTESPIETLEQERGRQAVNGKSQTSATYEEMMSTNQSLIFDQMMDVVYKTNVKINRLIPALTNLLGEPGKIFLYAFIDDTQYNCSIAGSCMQRRSKKTFIVLMRTIPL